MPSLCTVCSTIDFEDLPKTPDGAYCTPSVAELGRLATVEREKDSNYVFDPTDGGDFSEGPGHALFRMMDVALKMDFGWKHRQLQTLKKAAPNCPLCRLILVAVKQLLARLDDNNSSARLYKPSGTNYQVWLTRRPNNADGFLIFTPATGRYMYPLSSVGFVVDDDNQLADTFNGRPVQRDSSKRLSWGRAHEWISNCDNKHHERPGQTKLPKRVIDVGKSSSSKVRLWETKGQQGEYIAISHRWGADKKELTTTTDTLDDRLDEIAPNEMPQTVEDSVTITRRLGLRYFWIDTLCIVQDDDEDKLPQLEKMSEYYSGAYLTISASAARNGIFTQRTPPRYAEFLYTDQGGTSGLIKAYLDDFKMITASTADRPLKKDELSTRGWTFQERVLSPRTLYFASDQMYFECNRELVGENGFKAEGRLFGLKNKFHGRDTLGHWNQLVELYSERTFYMYKPKKPMIPSDRLPGLAGLAKWFQGKLNNEAYLAGIWLRGLPADLLWDTSGPCKQKLWRAPSWSWASLEGSTKTIYEAKDRHHYTRSIGGVSAPMNRYRNSTLLASLVDHHVIPKDAKAQLGQVKAGGWLKLNAPRIPIRALSSTNCGGRKVYRFQTRQGKRLRFTANFDYTITPSEAKRMQLYALVIGKDTVNSPIIYPSLIVRPKKGGAKDDFERVGMLLLEENTLGDEQPDQYGSFPITKLY